MYPPHLELRIPKILLNTRKRGIGGWSDGALYHFLRTGLRANGTYAPTYMPKYPLMSDEDLKDIIAWLRSDDPKLQPSAAVPPSSKPSLLTKILCRTIMKPFPMPSEPIPLPDTTDAVAWGRYLADNVYACFGCHSADFKTVNDLMPETSVGYYGGGNPMLNMDGEVIPSANITPDDETGIGRYSESEFVEVIRMGRKPDGTMVRYPMLPHGALSEAEVKAIYAFLRTVPPITNAVAKMN